MPCPPAILENKLITWRSSHNWRPSRYHFRITKNYGAVGHRVDRPNSYTADDSHSPRCSTAHEDLYHLRPSHHTTRRGHYNPSKNAYVNEVPDAIEYIPTPEEVTSFPGLSHLACHFPKKKEWPTVLLIGRDCIQSHAQTQQTWSQDRRQLASKTPLWRIFVGKATKSIRPLTNHIQQSIAFCTEPPPPRPQLPTKWSIRNIMMLQKTSQIPTEWPSSPNLQQDLLPYEVFPTLNQTTSPNG